jgi:hypothetical protein
MVTVNDEENTWAQVDLQKSSVDEETETCVGVRGVLGLLATSEFNNFLKI